VKKRIVFFLFPFLIFWYWLDPLVRRNQEGIENYNRKNWTEALNSFLTASSKNTQRGEILYNIGLVLYRQQKFTQAREQFQASLSTMPLKFKAWAYYNIANCYFQEKLYQQAVENYRRALILDQDDLDAKINLELALQKIRESSSPPEENQQEEQQPEPEKIHQPLMDYLNQSEREIQKKQQRPPQLTQNEKDW